MSDRRRIPANAQTALRSLEGQIKGVRFVDGTPAQVGVPVADLLSCPEGSRDRQVLFGETLTIVECVDGWCFVQADKDGYVGYLREGQVAPRQTLTHVVTAPATHLYEQADFKSRDLCSLSFGSRIAALETSGNFVRTPDGFLPATHLRPVSHRFDDPAEIAALFLGTPYLWGGNSRFGIDCSGLVQAACIACGIPCPGDSDMQANELGVSLAAGTRPQRNDVLFWKGHVAIVADAHTILHANAHHMSVTFEPLQDAIIRIEEQGDGPVTGHRRLPTH